MTEGNVADSGRLRPHNREAERAVLSCLLRHKDAVDHLPPTLKRDDFFAFGHGLIFEHMVSLHRQGKTVDYITLSESLKGGPGDALADAGGYAYLTDLWDAAPGSAGGLPHYAEIVRAYGMARRVIDLGHRLIELGFVPGQTADELRDRVADELFKVATHADHGGVTRQADAVRDYVRDLGQRVDRGPDAAWQDGAVPTGYRDLDVVTGGVMPRELTVIGARPSLGKTLMGLLLARNAGRCGVPSLFISLEQSCRELIARMVSAEARVSSHHLRRAVLDIDERNRVFDAEDRLTPLPITYDDTPRQSLFRIAITARREIRKSGIRLLVVDYLQLIDPDNRRVPRHEQVGEFSRGLKVLARELDIAIVALAQVNRGPEDRADRTPRLSDLRESGAIEADADCVMLLHKPEPPDRARETDIVEVHVAKQRNGPAEQVTVFHEKRFCDIRDWTGPEPEES